MPLIRRVAALLALATLVSAALVAQDGELDTSFHLDGRATYPWPEDYAWARAVAALPDGSILVGGDMGTAVNTTDFAVLRYLPNGNPDPAWGDSGARDVHVTDFEDHLEAIAIDAAGRAVLLGKVLGSGGAMLPALARLTATGDLDGTFGTAGGIAIASYPWTGFKHTYGVTTHLDGFLFAGNCGDCGAGSTDGLFLYRANSDGDPDTGFGSGGWVGFATGFSAGHNVWQAAEQPDGKILVAATRRTVGTLEVRLYRFLDDGELDLPFGGGDGIASFAPPDIEWNPSQVVVDPVDGAIYVGLREGLEPSGIGSGSIARLTSSGELDVTYGYPDLDLEEDSNVEGIALTSDRKIVTVGRIDANGAQPGGFFFARLLPSGEFDDTFDDNGVKRVEIDLVENGSDGGFAIALSGGKVVATGMATGPDGLEFATVRLTEDLIFTDGFERSDARSWSAETP